MYASAFQRSDTAGGQNIDREIQRERARMKKIKRPQINSSTREVSSTGRLRNDSWTAGSECLLPHDECGLYDRKGSYQVLALRSLMVRQRSRGPGGSPVQSGRSPGAFLSFALSGQASRLSHVLLMHYEFKFSARLIVPRSA